MNIILRALELAFAADRRHALLRLRAEARMQRAQQVAAEAEHARLALQEYERGCRAVHEVGRDCL